jgi:hypothetical protein
MKSQAEIKGEKRDVKKENYPDYYFGAYHGIRFHPVSFSLLFYRDEQQASPCKR